jgi:hypothetical protein
MASIVTLKVFPALFALEDRNGGFALPAVQAEGRDIDSEPGSGSSNLHRATTKTAVIHPKKRLLFQASVPLRFAVGDHDLFLVTVFGEAVRSAEIDRNVVVESSVEMNSWKLRHGVQSAVDDSVLLRIVEGDRG